jgi:hypothetical protein
LPCFYLLLLLLLLLQHREAVIGLTAWDEETQQQAALQAAAAISSGPIPRLRPICTNSSNESSPREQQQQAAAAAAVVRLPSIVAAAVVESPDSSECSSSHCAAAAAASAGDTTSTEQPSDKQQQQQQECQQSGVWFAGANGHSVAHADDSSSSSGSSSIRGDLREPLLGNGSSSDVTAAAGDGSGKRADRPADANAWTASSNNSSSSRVRRSSRASHSAAVPFMASVLMPPLASPFAGSTAAAAAAAATPHTSAVFAGHIVSFSEFPWIKFLSMLLLCLGFCGLAVLGALIPLCTWYFVTYMVLFLLLTVLVTFVFIKLILIDPLCKAAAAAKVYSCMERGEAAAAAGDQRSCRRGSSSSSSKRNTVQLSLWERLVTWANVLAGSQMAVQRPAAAAGGDEQQEQRQVLKHMSLFRREQLKQQLQLQQPFLDHNTSFNNIGEAAAAAAAAAASAAEAQSLLANDGVSVTPGAVTLVPPQHNSLVHIAAAGAVVAAAAGVVSGVCGLAGAALLAQTLLDFRVHPQVATATSVLLVCAGSCASSLAFAVQGRLNVSYALLFACVSIAGVCAGVWLIGSAVRKSCRPSRVMLLLAALTGVAAVCTAVFGAQGFAHDLAEGENLGFRALCSYV